MLEHEDTGVSVITKPWSIERRIAVAAIVFLGIGLVVFGAGSSNTEGRMSGAGSTLVNPILQHVSTAYQSYLAADRVDVARQQGTSNDWSAGATALDYDPVGSVGGLVRLADPDLTFAATDVPMAPEKLAADGLFQFPLINGAVVVIANIDTGADLLVLDAEVLTDIFNGSITNWTDPAIAALNPSTKLPNLPIAVRHRSDGSGTTWTFTGYLARSADWVAGQAASLAWPAGEGAQGNRGVIEAVKATPGAIGYAELGQANRSGLPIAQLVNGAGETVAANPQTIRSALASGIWTSAGGIVARPEGATGDWPMTATVYVVMRNSGQADRALGFFRYFYAEAPRVAASLGYVALTPEVVKEVEAYWAAAFQPQS